MANTSIRDITDTWTDGGTTYNAIKMNVTDSASNAASNLLTLQVAADTKLADGKDGAATIKSAAADALAVGLNGATNPAFLVDASTGTSATGVSVKSAAAAGGVALAVISSGTNENLTINAKGSGTVTINGTATGGITWSRAVTAASSVLSTSATAGIGYATGAGGAQTQGTSRTTGVTLNAITGAITLFSTAGSTTPASFTVTNSAVAATDVIVLSQKSGTDKYDLSVTAVGAGSFEITANTKSGTTSEAPVINFAVIKAVAA
jgi:hypothetical protein